MRNFLEFYYESHSIVTSKNEIDRVFDKLPKLIQEELLKEINIQIINGFQNFFGHFSKKSIDKIVPKLKEKQYLPSEIIYINN